MAQPSPIQPPSAVAAIAMAYFDHRQSYDALDVALSRDDSAVRFDPAKSAWRAIQIISAATMTAKPLDLADAALILGLAASWFDGIISAQEDGYGDPVTAGVAIAISNVAKMLLDLHPAANSTAPVARLIADLCGEADCLEAAAR